LTRKFVVICPGRFLTGGPEALHQLCHHLNQVPGVAASMHYIGGLDERVVDEYWSHYEVQAAMSPSLDGASVIIPSNVDPRAYSVSGGGRKWLWWLAGKRTLPLHVFGDCHHAFQSEYARRRLERLGYRGVMLTDYLRTTFDQGAPVGPKEDLIAYNGTKSALHMTRIRLAWPRLACVPIRGLSHAEVRSVFARAKVYVDFGPHPGRDRMPREAALLGCVIVTNREGAAGVHEDLPLPDELKVDTADIRAAAERVQHALTNYERLHLALEPYRQWIRTQRDIFAAEVRALALADPRPPAPRDAEQTARLAAGLDEECLETSRALDRRTDDAMAFAIEVEQARFGRR
jgi:hypothetical protein